MKKHVKFSEMRVAVALAAKKNNTAIHLFNYEVSSEPNKGWYKMLHRFELAKFFDTYNLWGNEKYEFYSRKLQENKIGLNQPFFVRFT